MMSTRRGICAALFLLISITKVYTNNIELKQLSTEQGLPGCDVRALYEDKIGYLWFGLDAIGLCRYDGKNYVTYEHHPDDLFSLSNNFILDIHADGNNNLWIATENGLNLFDRKHERFLRFYFINSGKLLNDWTKSIALDKEGNMWIGIRTGIIKIDKKELDRINKLLSDNPKSKTLTQNNLKFTRYLYDDSYYRQLGEIKVYHVTSDSNDKIWISTEKGLFVLDKKTNKIRRFAHIPTNSKSLVNDFVRFVYEYKPGLLIVCTNRGLCKYFEKEDRFELISFKKANHGELDLKGYFSFLVDSRGMSWIGLSEGIFVGKGIDPNEPGFNYEYLTEGKWGLKSNIIRDIREDVSGQVWIATKFGGIQIYQNSQQLFSTYTLETGLKKKGVADNYVLSAMVDEHDDIWLGTKYGGLLKYNKAKNTFESYYLEINDVNPTNSNRIECIYQNRNKDIWLGTQKGLYKLNRQNKSLTLFPMSKVLTMFEDRSGNFWIGSGHGVYVFDKGKEKVVRYTDIGKSHFFTDSSIFIYTITQDKLQNVWFGTYEKGVFIYNYNKHTIKHHRHNAKDPSSISDDMIREIIEDSYGNIWIGTKDNGLNLYDRNKDAYVHFSKKDGMPSNTVYSMIEDKNRHIWMGTHNGLSLFDPKNMRFVNYDQSHGLQSNIFEKNARAITSSGLLLFGGKNGFNMFQPDSIHFQNYKPRLVINYLKANDKIIKKELVSNTSIELPYDQNYLAFEFALLDFRNPLQNSYLYKLKGIDKDWVNSEARNYVTYPDLPHGKYEFLIKNTGNYYGQEPQLISVSIVIHPPFWLTGFAYVIYALLFLGFLYAIFWFATIRANYRHKLNEAKHEVERSNELHQAKLQFFTNISHEFQAPLTLIMAPVEKLTNSLKIEEPERKYVELIQKNTRRLSQLIDQLLYFRKAQNEVIELKVSQGNIVDFLEETTRPFSFQAAKYDINFNFIAGAKQIDLWFDPDKMEKIVSNLLMNAFKYTPRGGKVELHIEHSNEYPTGLPNVKNGRTAKPVKIEVVDSGRGMTQEQTQLIFKRFYRVENSNDQKGVGIGLELTKTLVEMHRGIITVDSKLNEGSKFTVYLLQGNHHFNQQDISGDIIQAKDYVSEVNIDLLAPDDCIEIKPVNEPGKNKPVILIVEDNNDLRNFLGENLNDHYNLLLASNGLDGLQQAIKNVPDLIISDVIMPEMDGIDMCKQLKTNILTSHIPIILLTRKAYIEDKITGLLTGAVDYIEKPFSLQFLQLRIRNLFVIQQKTTDLLKKELEDGEIMVSEISAYDKKLLNKCRNVIMEKLSDAEFSVSNLGKEVGLSRSQLHRKISALTGQSPAEMLYATRLSEAKKMLTIDRYPVSEVAHLTGFKSSSSFSTVFKKHFGISPTDFVEGKIKPVS